MTPQELYERYRFDEPTRPAIRELRYFPPHITLERLALIEADLHRTNQTRDDDDYIAGTLTHLL